MKTVLVGSATSHPFVLAEAQLPTGQWGIVLPLTFGRARLHLAEAVDSPVFLDGW